MITQLLLQMDGQEALKPSKRGDAASKLGSGPRAGVVADTSLVSDQNWSIWDSGEWWMLLAAQSMAVGTVLVRYVTKYADPIMATGYHMLLGGIPLLVLSAQQESSLLAERLPLLTGSTSLLLSCTLPV